MTAAVMPSGNIFDHGILYSDSVTPASFCAVPSIHCCHSLGATRLRRRSPKRALISNTTGSPSALLHDLQQSKHKLKQAASTPVERATTRTWPCVWMRYPT